MLENGLRCKRFDSQFLAFAPKVANYVIYRMLVDSIFASIHHDN